MRSRVGRPDCRTLAGLLCGGDDQEARLDEVAVISVVHGCRFVAAGARILMERRDGTGEGTGRELWFRIE